MTLNAFTDTTRGRATLGLEAERLSRAFLRMHRAIVSGWGGARLGRGGGCVGGVKVAWREGARNSAAMTERMHQRVLRVWLAGGQRGAFSCDGVPKRVSGMMQGLAGAETGVISHQRGRTLRVSPQGGREALCVLPALQRALMMSTHRLSLYLPGACALAAHAALTAPRSGLAAPSRGVSTAGGREARGGRVAGA